ncbi:hypothetical protein J6590_075303 [Homalodisca vitripennis]|nr:hypothetical protein J6590_075303 [Homalodisca vitripennis]
MNYTRIRVGCKPCGVTVYKKNWKVHERQTEYIAELENLAAQMTSISQRVSNSALQHLCRSRADKKAVMTSIDRCLDRRMAYDLMVADDHVNILLDVRNYVRSLITALGKSSFKAKNILAKELFLFSPPPPAVVGIHMKLCVLRRDLLRVRRLCNLPVASKSTGDLRSQSRSGNAISREMCQVVHVHITNYDLKTTHRGGKPKHCSDAGLNVKIMHQLFLEEYPVW